LPIRVLVVRAIVSSVEIEHLEPVRSRIQLLSGRWWALSRDLLNFWQRLGALVRIIFNLHALVRQPRHHAGPGKQGIVNGVRGDIGISLIEANAEDDKVMDMVKILPDHSLGDVGVDAAYDKVA